MKKLKILSVMLVAFACTALPLAPVMAWENPICDILTDPQERELANCDQAETIFDKGSGAVIAIFSVMGVLAVGMIVFGGIRYMISQGDPGKVKKAKDTILYSVIGLIVALSAFAITMFILGAIS